MAIETMHPSLRPRFAPNASDRIIHEHKQCFNKYVEKPSIKLTGNPDTHQIATIATVVIAGIAWLSAFYLLWHRMEKQFTYKTGAIMALKWTGAAALLFAALTVLQLLMDRFLLGIGA